MPLVNTKNVSASGKVNTANSATGAMRSARNRICLRAMK